MASTKELFASGLNYILRDIKDTKEELENGREYLRKYINKNGETSPKARNGINKITNDLKQLVKLLKKHEHDFFSYIEEYSYTKEDMKKYNIHPATDEELKADYEQDLKETGYDSRYTEEMHKALIDKVNEQNKAEGLPLLSY